MPGDSPRRARRPEEEKKAKIRRVGEGIRRRRSSQIRRGFCRRTERAGILSPSPRSANRAELPTIELPQHPSRSRTGPWPTGWVPVPRCDTNRTASTATSPGATTADRSGAPRRRTDRALGSGRAIESRFSPKIGMSGLRPTWPFSPPARRTYRCTPRCLQRRRSISLPIAGRRGSSSAARRRPTRNPRASRDAIARISNQDDLVRSRSRSAAANPAPHVARA